jgi:hypothetical protein
MDNLLDCALKTRYFAKAKFLTSPSLEFRFRLRLAGVANPAELDELLTADQYAALINA